LRERRKIRIRELYGLLGELPGRDRPIASEKVAEERCSSCRLERPVLDVNAIENVPAVVTLPLDTRPQELG